VCWYVSRFSRKTQGKSRSYWGIEPDVGAKFIAFIFPQFLDLLQKLTKMELPNDSEEYDNER